MAGTMVAEPAVPSSSLAQRIVAGSNNRAATRCATTVGDRHQNGAHSAVHGDLAASYAGCLAKSLAVFGLDVCQPLNLSWYGSDRRSPDLAKFVRSASCTIHTCKIDLGLHRTLPTHCTLWHSGGGQVAGSWRSGVTAPCWSCKGDCKCMHRRPHEGVRGRRMWVALGRWVARAQRFLSLASWSRCLQRGSIC